MTHQEFQKRYQYNPSTDCLGEGGFGKVYKAYDTHRDRNVAIKMAEVKPHLEEVRLKKEVEIISKLPSHPNIAYYEECYTFSTFAGEYDFGVLQYYEEGNLQQLLTDKQLSYEQKDSLLRQILDGIIFLHSQGIIHRDLKPQNILISNRNGKYIPKITDFGISKKLDVNKSTFFTNSLAGAGTLSFSSPEQLLGNAIRKNTDLWSFGVIACWMFTGKLPFNTGNQTVTSEAGRIELFRQITSGDITVLIRQLPFVWQKLVKQCIVVDSDKRIGGAVKCLELLEGKVEVDMTGYSNGNTTENNAIPTQTTDKKDVAHPTSFTDTSTSYHQPIHNSKGNPTPWIIAGIGVLIISLIIFFTTNRSSDDSGPNRTIVSTADTVAIAASPPEEIPVADTVPIYNDAPEKTESQDNRGTVTDIDGNVYKTVKIGNQLWMAENLVVKHYQNGDLIPNITNNKEWIYPYTTGAWCYYDNYGIYSVIYNWRAVYDYRGIAPTGWHIPTDDEWMMLERYLMSSGYDINNCGFNPILSGSRSSSDGTFSSLNSYSAWWSSSEFDNANAWARCINKGQQSFWRIKPSKLSGFSIRCVKDK